MTIGLRGVARATKVAVLALLSACASRPAPGPSYVFDPTHTFVYFQWPASGLSTQRGRFDRTRGEAEFDRLGRSARVEVRIETGSVSTGVAALDARLCAPDLLDCETHAQAVLRAEQFTFGDGGLPTQVTGSLTLRGKTLPLTLRAQRFNCYPNLLLLREVCGGDFEGVIEPAAFGLAAGVAGATPERISLFVQVEAIKQ